MRGLFEWEVLGRYRRLKLPLRAAPTPPVANAWAKRIYWEESYINLKTNVQTA